jgi:hypothetical protein
MTQRFRGTSVPGLLCILGVLLLLAETAGAADPIGRMSISGQFGIGGYQMGEINDAIGRSNGIIARERPEWKLPDRIRSGFEFTADATYDITPDIRAGLTYGTTSGSSGVDFLQTIDVKPSGSMLIPRVFYRLPYRPTVDMSLRVFGGLVLLRNVETKVDHENTSESDERLETLTAKASGTGFIGGLLAEYTLADRFTLAFETGYRFAKAGFDSGTWSIQKLRDPLGDPDNDRIPNNKDLREESYLWGFLDKTYNDVSDVNLPNVRRDLDADFSGVIARIGLRVYIF